ncbi:MAG: RAD55 family ATPase [Candidatus Micrarchaeota archaeon]|nr:RAD55 family ATPase [Candidatus Micrarchaeota archaeon]
MKSGIKGLDELFCIRDCANILLMGPPGPEKLLFAVQFLAEGELLKQPCIYVTTDVSPSEIEEQAKHINADFSAAEGRRSAFIDCYSWALSAPPKGRRDIPVPGPSALDDISIGITQSLMDCEKKPEENGRIVFQSVSTLLLYNNAETAYRFIQITGARLKAAKMTTLYMLETGMHEDRAVVTLKHLMDSVIELKIEGKKNYISAPLDGLRDWAEFKIGENGVEVLRKPV